MAVLYPDTPGVSQYFSTYHTSLTDMYKNAVWCWYKAMRGPAGFSFVGFVY